MGSWGGRGGWVGGCVKIIREDDKWVPVWVVGMKDDECGRSKYNGGNMDE
jgi:hypothetical protein